eukprot:6471147-Prymnesium_polylepis.1
MVGKESGAGSAAQVGNPIGKRAARRWGAVCVPTAVCAFELVCGFAPSAAGEAVAIKNGKALVSAPAGHEEGVVELTSGRHIRWDYLASKRKAISILSSPSRRLSRIPCSSGANRGLSDAPSRSRRASGANSERCVRCVRTGGVGAQTRCTATGIYAWKGGIAVEGAFFFFSNEGHRPARDS